MNDDDPGFFLMRFSDKMLYRGARLWRWTKSWRRAAYISRSGWLDVINPKLDPKEKYGLFTLDELHRLEELSGIFRTWRDPISAMRRFNGIAVDTGVPDINATAEKPPV